MSYFCVEDFHQQAQQRLPIEVYDFFAGGAGQELSVQRNQAAFAQVQFRPRVLRPRLQSELTTELLGQRLASPLIIAPTAFHCLAHADGEVATAAAAHATNHLMIISMAATQSLETIFASLTTSQQPKQFWLQLYLQSDRQFMRALIQQAEALGCQALVITVDSPVFGRRLRDLRHQFHELPDGLACANLFDENLQQTRQIEFNPQLNWDDIAYIQSVSNLPVVLKGIMHPADAKLALAHGIKAIIVSNHGGRQLDGVAATLNLLPDIVRQVQQQIPIIIDGGIRYGRDILACLALGASAVAIGRPVVWALACDGRTGVEALLNMLDDELLQAMTLCGCQSLATVDDDILLPSRMLW